ncbi:hypothetical protein D9615_003346 [Tricholomella constricta]|uniref:Trichodiene synthase n=1 Tax=Tricholomella constricta TaxID=117010 RepID=A0A8H5HIG9_9AGAR|nr:hypothetical protein D9615_003346 [Tricholomella constricta]
MVTSVKPHQYSTTSCNSTPDKIACIVRDFLKDHQMSPSDKNPYNYGNGKDLEVAMREAMKDHGIPPSMELTLRPSARFIELAFHGCTLAEKTNIGLYTWFLIYIDDVSAKDIAPFIAFEQRFLEGIPQMDPVLDAMASLLKRMFHQYSAFHANSIINATFECINGTCIEPALVGIHLGRSSPRFPQFLRDRTGFSIAYALMVFPTSRPLDYVVCFQAMADMDVWISLTNDILSYHKERLAGETVNYVSNRACVEGNSPLQVVADIRGDLLHARKNIYAALETSGDDAAARHWRIFECGYITWHLEQTRYRLADLVIS